MEKIDMGTQQQKNVAKTIVKNATLDKPLTGGEIAEVNGYSKSMQDNPKRVIETQGVQEELEVLGFSEDNAKKVVSDIMLNEDAKDNDRLKASEMVFKVRGTFAPEKSINLNIEQIPETEEARQIAQKYEEEIINNLE